VTEDIVAIGGFFTTVITAFIAFGPIGRAIAAKLTRSSIPNPGAEVLDLVDTMEHRIEALQQQVSELSERQDFTERLVAKTREKPALGAGGQG
jgi:hypothetical protein